ncbi:hypothetical protein ACPXB5_11485 [Micromonospora arida]|uniref:hypothetical protein n=1 Tax=Micromonospora arida TaxID=2203715 RepID=UPI003CF24B7F
MRRSILRDFVAAAFAAVRKPRPAADLDAERARGVDRLGLEVVEREARDDR